ncbi:hypothetical protein [Methanosarcina barkeri]|uniref:hypothetical protein n=1 Tax=Methanosarcina barkeri TaxID=2208 RepID=UPI000A94A56F|nr:hypothetical protein [Methanosarcina barkeri]
MLLLMIAWIVGFIVGVFLLKFLFVTVAVQASLAYNAIIERNIQGKYQQVNVIPDLVKTLVDSNIYQRYSLDPLRVVKYPAFYRKGFKFFLMGVSINMLFLMKATVNTPSIEK